MREEERLVDGMNQKQEIIKKTKQKENTGSDFFLDISQLQQSFHIVTL